MQSSEARERHGNPRATAALLDIAREISGRLDLTECLNRICEIVGAALNADRSSVILWSDRKHGFVAAADVGTPPDLFARFRRVTFSFNGSGYLNDLAAGNIVILDRDSSDPLGRQLLEDLRLATHVIAPLAGAGAAFGGLNLGYEQPVHLGPDDLDLIRGIAQQATIAIETARLFTNTQKAAAFRASLSDLSILLSRERELERGVQHVCEKAREVFGVDGAALALAEDGSFRIRGAVGTACEVLLGSTITADAPNSVATQALRERRVLYVNSYRKSAYSAQPVLPGINVESVLVAPLAVDGHPQGLLMLPEMMEPYRFSDVHVEEATILAAAAGAWLENNQLVAALREEGRKLAEQTSHLQTANGALARKSKEAQNANRALEDLIYVASHDLRAPLINLEGFAHELRGQVRRIHGLLNGEGAELLAELDESAGFIRAATARMHALVEGLLDVSRCGVRDLVWDTVDVTRLIAGIAEAQAGALLSAGIEMRVGPLPAVVADRVGLRTVFANLLDNAIKYMGDASTRVIEIGYEDAVMHRFFVRDSGAGISHRDQARIFRLFHRGNHRGIAGEGVGLTVARRIIERHGGTVWVESQLGKGATFWFTLPKAPH